MMRIEIRLFATLAGFARNPAITDDIYMEVEPDSRVIDVAERLNVPTEDIKLIFVNGRHTDLHHVLSEGDRVGLFPPVGGG